MKTEYLRLDFVRQMKAARMACTETQQLRCKVKQDRDSHHTTQFGMKHRNITLKDRNIFIYCLSLVDTVTCYLLLVGGGRYPVELVEMCAS